MELGLFSVEKTRLRGILFMYIYMSDVWSRGEGSRLFSVVPRDMII